MKEASHMASEITWELVQGPSLVHWAKITRLLVCFFPVEHTSVSGGRASSSLYFLNGCQSCLELDIYEDKTRRIRQFKHLKFSLLENAQEVGRVQFVFHIYTSISHFSILYLYKIQRKISKAKCHKHIFL